VQAIEEAARGVLDARRQFPNSTLADLYDPIAMPGALSKAHAQLNSVVDRAYGKKTFDKDSNRVAFLFDLYDKYSTLLPGGAKPRRAKVKKAR
jgi:hypothetical protein